MRFAMQKVDFGAEKVKNRRHHFLENDSKATVMAFSAEADANCRFHFYQFLIPYLTPSRETSYDLVIHLNNEKREVENCKINIR